MARRARIGNWDFGPHAEVVERKTGMKRQAALKSVDRMILDAKIGEYVVLTNRRTGNLRHILVTPDAKAQAELRSRGCPCFINSGPRRAGPPGFRGL